MEQVRGATKPRVDQTVLYLHKDNIDFASQSWLAPKHKLVPVAMYLAYFKAEHSYSHYFTEMYGTIFKIKSNGD